MLIFSSLNALKGRVLPQYADYLTIIYPPIVTLYAKRWKLRQNADVKSRRLVDEYAVAVYQNSRYILSIEGSILS